MKNGLVEILRILGKESGFEGQLYVFLATNQGGAYLVSFEMMMVVAERFGLRAGDVLSIKMMGSQDANRLLQRIIGLDNLVMLLN